MALRAPYRILLNLLMDSLLAGASVPLAVLLAAPDQWPGDWVWWLGALPGAALLQKGPTSPVKGKLMDGEQEESTFVNEHGVGRVRAVP